MENFINFYLPIEVASSQLPLYYIFFVWDGTYIELLGFLRKLNNLAPTIKFTSNISQEKYDFLQVKEKFFVRLRNRRYPVWFLIPIFEEVKYESRNKLLKPRAKDTCPLKPHIFFKTYRNPLFDGVNLKDVILSNIGNDFDVTVCFKGTPPLSETVCRKF